MNKKMKSGLLVGTFIIALFAILYFTGVIGQSIITPPVQAQVLNGQVFWIATISANGVKDGVGFDVNPSRYTLTQDAGVYPAGTQVVPSDPFIVYFSQRENFCTYRLVAASLPSAFGLNRLNYFRLSTPERSIMVDVCVNANCKVVDASSILSRTTFSRNGGQVVVESQGGLTGKIDCASGTNTAVYFDKNGVSYFVPQSTLESKFKTWSIFDILYGYDAFVRSLSKDSVFTSTFSSLTVSSASSTVKGSFGSDVIFGSGVLTVTADASVFKSAFIVPQTTCNPSVSVSATDIKMGSTGSGKFTVSADRSCTIAYTVSITRGSVSPTSGSVSYSGSTVTKNLAISAPSTSGAYTLTVKACSGNQLVGDLKCDSDSITKNFVQDTPAKYCGDTSCDASIGESFTTCPTDCTSPIDPCMSDNPPPSCTPPLECKDKLGGLISGSPVQTESCGFWCKLGLSEPTLKNTCSYNYLPLLFVLLALIIFGIVLYFVLKKRGKK